MGTFSGEGNSTCGADFYSYRITAGGESTKLQIWDTAGQERFRAISKAYFRNAVGAILVFDITNAATFEDLTGWLGDLQSLAAPNAFILLVANKIDLGRLRQVGHEEIKDFADRHQLEVVETSACSGQNIEAAFTRLTLELVMRIRSGAIKVPLIAIDQQQIEPVKRKRGCCA
jgi:small GTP-binding protein